MRKAKADQIPAISSNLKQRNLSPRVSKAVRDFWRGFVEQTLNYKDIITKRYVLRMSIREIARDTGGSRSGISDFLRAFEKCDELSFPLPTGITNEGIAMKVYGHIPGETGRDTSYEYPDYAKVNELMNERSNMTLQWCWNKYSSRCERNGLKGYQYRQFCLHFSEWCDENYETAHFNAVIGQSMEVDFAGQTFELIDRLTGEVTKIVVYVACLPYSQYIYAEGMVSTKDPEWIEVNNNALQFFGGVPALVICDNCKQAVIANKDWIQPELNQNYSEWAEYNHTVVLPAKVKHPKYYRRKIVIGKLSPEQPTVCYSKLRYCF